MNNDEIYHRLMESRKRDPKRYGLTIIAVEYEDVLHYSRSEKKDGEELKWRLLKLSERIKKVMSVYKVSMSEIADYFRSRNYSLDFV